MRFERKRARLSNFVAYRVDIDTGLCIGMTRLDNCNNMVDKLAVFEQPFLFFFLYPRAPIFRLLLLGVLAAVGARS